MRRSAVVLLTLLAGCGERKEGPAEACLADTDQKYDRLVEQLGEGSGRLARLRDQWAGAGPAERDRLGGDIRALVSRQREEWSELEAALQERMVVRGVRASDTRRLDAIRQGRVELEKLAGTVEVAEGGKTSRP